MIASLMMYLRPETAEAHARYWALICEELAARGIAAPETLNNKAEEFTVWKAPDLTLSQTSETLRSSGSSSETAPGAKIKHAVPER